MKTRMRFLKCALLLCILSFLFFSCEKKDKEAAVQDPHARVQGLRITRGSLISTIPLIGFLSSDRVTHIVAEINSTVIESRLSEGTIVNKGDVLLVLDDEALVSARDSAQYQAANARLQLETVEELHKQNLASNIELQQAQSGFYGAESQYKQQSLLLDKTVIKAPFTGKIIATNDTLSKGTLIAPGAFVAQIADLTQPRIKSKISDFFLERIQINDVVDILVLDDQSFMGRISDIGQVVSPQTGTFDLEISIDDVSNFPAYKLGQVVDLHLTIGPRHDTLRPLIPRAMVRSDDKGEYIFFEQDGKAQKAYITLGEEFAGRVEITSVRDMALDALVDRALLITGLRTLVHGQKLSVQVIGTTSEF